MRSGCDMHQWAVCVCAAVMAALNTTRPASEEDELVAEAAVSLLTDLQSRQAAGNRSLNTLMEQQVTVTHANQPDTWQLASHTWQLARHTRQPDSHTRQLARHTR